MNTISVATRQRVEFVEVTPQIRQWLRGQDFTSGVLSLFVPHTTAGITINEHADPDVARGKSGNLYLAGASPVGYGQGVQ